MPSEKYISRLAPTPSGFLHLGNLANFYLTWKLVRQSRGSLRLRIDDCDSTRVRPEFIDDIFATLNWIGIDYDHGPIDSEDFKNHSQALRRDRYWQVLQQTTDTFVCDCSRSQLPKGKPYPGTCRDRNKPFQAGTTSIRLRAPETAMGDFVLWRKDDLPAYLLVSVVDDVDYNTNLIVRGEDLLETSEAQRLLAAKAGFDSFQSIRFIHHPMLTDNKGQKLAKSEHALSLKTMRAKGMQKEEILRQLDSFVESVQIS